MIKTTAFICVFRVASLELEVLIMPCVVSEIENVVRDRLTKKQPEIEASLAKIDRQPFVWPRQQIHRAIVSVRVQLR